MPGVVGQDTFDAADARGQHHPARLLAQLLRVVSPELCPGSRVLGGGSEAW
ncbi:hypothetical protein T261_08756 [Streptomyces lydicus]|nr:hypothetical protein T261_08756 [Streptomyces lydicus]